MKKYSVLRAGPGCALEGDATGKLVRTAPFTPYRVKAALSQ